ILREEAFRLFEDSAYSDVILEEPEVWGVDRFDRDGAVVRTVLKTRPMHQWAVGRALRSRVLRRFDEAGIRIPVTIIPPQGGDSLVPRPPRRPSTRRSAAARRLSWSSM